MALAGHPLAFSTSSDDVTYAEVDGITDLSFGPSRDMLESTDFKDTSGAKTRLAGLKDGTIQVSGDYESADTGQATILSRWADGAACWAKILWNGSTGHKVACIVESFQIAASVGGKVTFTATLQFNGAFSAV